SVPVDGVAGEQAGSGRGGRAGRGVDARQVNGLIGQIDVPPDHDGAAARYRRDGVMDQIVERVEEPAFIGRDQRDRIETFGAEGNLLLVGETVSVLEPVVDQRGDAG